MTRSEFSSACASAGANKSSRVRHQSTLPRVRGSDPCCKKRGGCAVNRAVAAAGDLMQCAERQRPTGKPSVHRGDTEGYDGVGAPVLALDLPDLGAQRLEGGRRPHV
jgi:hypothetical protein